MSSQFGIDPDTISPDDFVADHLASSVLPRQIGQILDPEEGTVMTDEVVAVSMVTDESGSMRTPAIIAAVVEGYNRLLEFLRVSSIRRQIHLQSAFFANNVRELHTFKPLVDPATNALVVPQLDQATYRPNGMTALIQALMKVSADNEFFAAALDLPDVMVLHRHVIVGVTDGFTNVDAHNDAERFRRFVRRMSATETWDFLMFCITDPQTASDFANQLRRSGVSWNGTDEEATQVMYEAMCTGWGYFVDDPSKIASITNPDERAKAELYLAAEQIILDHFEPSYKAVGGLGVRPEKVWTLASKDPDKITEMFGTQVSSSIVRAGSKPMVSTTSSPPALSAGGNDDIF